MNSVDEQMNRCFFRYESMKSVKIKINIIDKGNECVIDFYRLIDTMDINQIRFTDPIFIDLSIDISMPTFIDWLIRVETVYFLLPPPIPPCAAGHLIPRCFYFYHARSVDFLLFFRRKSEVCEQAGMRCGSLSKGGRTWVQVELYSSVSCANIERKRLWKLSKVE